MAYKVIKADLIQHAEKIINFWRDNFSAWPVEKFDWYYKNNIYGTADCWLVLDTDTDKVLGATAIFPRQYFCNGKNILCGIAGDFAVDKQHRTLGAALALQKALVNFSRNGKYDFVYGYPNDRSRPVQKRAGFQVVGATSRLVRIFKIKPYAARYISTKSILYILDKIAGVGLSLFARESYHRLAYCYEEELLETADCRFDALFEKAKSNFNLIGVRTSDFLNWRFAECPYQKYLFYTVFSKNDKALLGYVIYYQHELCFSIADIFYETNVILETVLLPSFMRYIKRIGCDHVSVLFFGRDDLLSILKKYQFIKRESDRYILALPISVENIDTITCNQHEWFFFEADND